MSSSDPYENAVDRFEALCDSVIVQPAKSSRQIIDDAGIPKSTGYRTLGALEKVGFLARDVNGEYLRGDAAWQTGLAAWGFGRGANSTLPLVRYLRAQTGRTACFCIVAEGIFHIGPFSLARGSDHVVPLRASTPFWADPEDPENLVLELDGDQVSAIWAPTTGSKASSVAGFAVLTRHVPQTRRIALVTQVRAVAQMARASMALEENRL